MKTIMYIAISLITFGPLKAQQTPKAFRDPVSFKLKTGLTLIVAENQSAQKVYSGFSVDTDPGSTLEKISQMDLMSRIFNVSSDKEEFKTAFLRMFLALKTPVMTEVSFEKFKVHLYENLKKEGHPYGELVTEATVSKLQLNDLKEFYAKHIHTPNACLTITGNITPEDAKALVQKAIDQGNADITSADVETVNNLI